MKTRAAICVSPGQPLEIDLVDVRGPGPGEVLIEIRASGICHSDWHQISGDLPLYPYPIIAGHEGAGIVLEVGPGVTTVTPGDHVIPVSIPECRQCPSCNSGRTNLCVESFASFSRTETPFSRNGQPIFMYSGVSTFANHTVVKEISVVKIRKDAPFDTVCYAGCGVMTGVGAVFKTAGVRPQSSVAVLGIGGVGLNVLQASRMAGATTIIAVDINPARLEMARQFGATHCVDPGSLDGTLAEHIQALTGGGADFSFECVGISDLMLQAIEAVRPGWGVSVAVGAAAMEDPVKVPSFTILSGRTWKGSLLGDVRPRSELPGIVDLYMDGHIELDRLITHRLPLEQINHGFDLMRSGDAIRAVVVF